MRVGSLIAVRAAVALLFAATALVAASADVAATGDGVTKISAGGYHTCALRSGGTVWCWGWTPHGQVGDGTRGDPGHSNSRLSPVQVRQGTGLLTGVKAVGTGERHSCAVKSDGTVWCWGDDADGQLGDGTTGVATYHDRLKAVQVRRGSGSLTGITAVSGGLLFTCARRDDGTAWCWGAAFGGQVGDGTTGDSNGLRLKAVQVRQESGYLTGVTAVAAGDQHACARTSNGAAWCWGAADFGQTGDGSTGGSDGMALKAVRVRTSGGPLTGVSRVAAGDLFSCARTSDGAAWCWGRDTDGQLGDGTTGDPTNHRRLTAVRVKQGSGFLTSAADVDAGASHACARKSDGSAWCWGWDAYAQLGDGTTGDANERRLKAVQVVGPVTEPPTPHLSGVSAISGGRLHTCVAKGDQTAWCWGEDGSGQGGDGTGDIDPHASPVKVLFP